MAEKIMKAVELSKTSAAFKKKYPNLRALVDAGWKAYRKYDGCMGIAVLEEKGPRGMYSRTGKPVASCDHILDALHHRMRDYWAAGGLSIAIIGEVWEPGVPFPTISGKFRASRPSPELQFVMFDYAAAHADEPPYILGQPLPYWERYLGLKHLAGGFPLSLAERVSIGPHEDPEAVARQYVEAGGYDGLVLRDPDARYTVGLAKEGQIVKVKPLLSLDLRIEEIKTEPGDKTGRPVHTIRVSYRGVDTWVGSGVPHDKTLLGRGDIVQIDSLGLTEDGKLREPRFVAVRYDKEFPDE